MIMGMSWVMTSVVPALMAQSSGADLIANLLTGGGFVFLAAIMGGLALWNKNQSESIVSINKASQEFVEGARTEVASARAESHAAREDARKARLQAASARRELEELQEIITEERQKWGRSMRRQKIANEDHNRWDAELKAELVKMGGVIRDAPPLFTFSSDDPDYPLR